MRPGVICVLALWFSIAVIQAQSTGGSLRGSIQDSTGARVSGANIKVVLSESSQMRQVSADAQGAFRIEDLTPGEWRISVDAHGFASASADVSVAVRTVRNIVVTLRPSQVSQSVKVSSQGSSIATQPIDLASNVHQAVVTTRDLEGMPLPARSFSRTSPTSRPAPSRLSHPIQPRRALPRSRRGELRPE
jgi:Carboxypeptidase regulatory-like domain